MLSTKMHKTLIVACTVFLTFSSCKKDNPIDEAPSIDQELTETLKGVSKSGGLAFFQLPSADDYNQIPQDPANPLTEAKVELGKFLYHETGIARNPRDIAGLGTYSCASCHFASAGFQAGRHQGIGEGGEGFGFNGESRDKSEAYNVLNVDVQPIRSPTTLNSAYQIAMLWNGQFGAKGINANTEYAWTAGTPKALNHLGFHGVETQAIAGLSVHRQLEDTSDVSDLSNYKALFDAAFPERPVAERYNRVAAGLAIAAYERTLLPNEAMAARRHRCDERIRKRRCTRFLRQSTVWQLPYRPGAQQHGISRYWAGRLDGLPGGGITDLCKCSGAPRPGRLYQPGRGYVQIQGASVIQPQRLPILRAWGNFTVDPGSNRIQK